MQLGTENYWGKNDKINYTNEAGRHGDLLDEDKLSNYQLNVFYRSMLQLWDRWLIEASLGYNKNNIHYEEIFPVVTDARGSIAFEGMWMPRLASSFQLCENWALRASVAKGYSTPTIEEIRPSDRIINTALAAETGTNIEVGSRYSLPSKKLLIDISAYRYKMQDGIVRQINELGEDYYVNAGNIDQKGIELGLWANLVNPKQNGLLRFVGLHTATAYQHYRFVDYNVAENDYSGNAVTAVPEWTMSNTLQVDFLESTSLSVLHQYVSEFPLDDANTVFAAKYHLLQAKVNYELPMIKRATIHLFVGADNLLNEKYSLGNDINAFGGRYFNAAATRNFYAGIKMKL
jgi:iron complex outermembrane receptor protein